MVGGNALVCDGDLFVQRWLCFLCLLVFLLVVGLIEVREEGLQIRQLRKRPEAGLEYVEAVDLLLLQVLVFGAEELRESQRA